MNSDSGDDEAYVWIWLPDATEPVVAGRLARDGDRLVFNYGRSYLGRADAIAIFDAELPLRRGAIPPRDGLRLSGCLRDAAPDAWGRRVILNRAFGTKWADLDVGALDELTYLLESGPAAARPPPRSCRRPGTVEQPGQGVGESLSVLPVIERLRAEDLPVMITTGTTTSAALMAERLPGGAFHQFVPVDRAPFVTRFLDHWRPDLAVWVESEFWPVMVEETARRGVPMVLVQGRISDRSFRRWRRFPGLIGRLLSHFDACLAQSAGDAERLEALGGRGVACLGNLKAAMPPLPADPAELDRLSALIAGRPVWLAASTHAGEEVIAARVHQRLAATRPGLLTVIVPRHPDRSDEIAATLRGMALSVAVRSRGAEPGPGTAVWLADTIGEMGLFCRLAQAVFVGKSLAPSGGQNPMEPARLGRPVLFGPHMANFAEMAAAMLDSGAARRVADADGLADALARLPDDPAEARTAAARALAFAESRAGGMVEAVVERLLAALASGPDRKTP
ncbi:MAG: HipA N-terminal domain-containing protein [Caulobacter sp.]|nr:HipA N-terminal domain-containing protein [Caulobacter sp.]